MKQALIALLVGVVFTSCSEGNEPYTLPPGAAQLIAGDSTKTWMLAKRFNGGIRMNMGDCFLHYRQTFGVDGTVQDNNGEARNCGPSLVGAWEITTTEKGNSYIKITSPQIPELLGIEEDHKFFKILYLSGDTLQLSFSHNQFGTKKIITDYLVTEDVQVPDRNFHY